MNDAVRSFVMDAVRNRDGCCLIGLFLKDGCIQGYDVHHIDTRGSGGEDTMENMICVCRKHHNAAHARRISKGALRAALNRFYKYEYSPDQLEEG